MSKTYRRNHVATALIIRGNKGGGAHKNKASKRRRTRSSERQSLLDEYEEYLADLKEMEESNE